MPKLSVTIITKNESSNISAVLESVAWADEVVVVDCGSTDETVSIAKRFTDRVSFHKWEGYGIQKNHAAGLAENDWILSVDADERVSPELGKEIRERLANNPQYFGYRIPRVNYYLDRWIKSTDWYPDYQLRLYDRRVATWNTRLVHESLNVKGKIGTLKNDLQHYAYQSLSDHLATIDRYTTLAAQQMYTQGQRASWLNLTIHPQLAFLRNYALRFGFREGLSGLVISLMNAYYVFLKMAKLWELQRRGPY